MLLSIGRYAGMAEEMDINEIGELSSSVRSEVFRSVIFTNGYDNTSISVFWEGPEDSVFMFDMQPLEEINVNTANTHRFYATELDDVTKRVSPYSLVIKEGQDSYSFAPVQSSSRAHRQHPSVRIIGQRTTSMNAKFRILVPSCDYYYVGGDEWSYQGSLKMGKETTTNTYEGHVFVFTEPGDKERVLARFVMHKDQVVYTVTNPKYKIPQHMLELEDKEQHFLQSYFNRTGIHWRGYFGPDGPRPPPTLFMWPADEVGQVHHVISSNGRWNCEGLRSECQSPESVNLEIEVVSLAPRAFIIENVLTDFEVSEIIRLAAPKLHGSFVGNYDEGGGRTSETRTSRNSWLSRTASDVIDTIYRRAADILQLDEALLHSKKNAEDMQVVNYENGMKYDSHHDWGVSGVPETRFITLLLYLTDMEDEKAGGETAFPKGADGMGFKVQPKKGDAVLFYNLLPDGNCDDLALHAALPVLRGKKWLANFWVWDPKRKD